MQRRPISALVLALLVACASACRSTPHDTSTRASLGPAEDVRAAPRGWLLVVGGGGTTPEMYTRMLAAAGGNDAHVVVLPQASELADTGDESVKVWKERGATNVEWLDLADPARAAEKLRAARVIWFPGGVQTRLMKALDAANVTELVRERYRDGAVVGGTSAGAAVMTHVMITGDYDLSFKPADKKAPTKKADGTEEDDDSGLRYVRRGTNVFAEGLGLLDGAIVDQHFVRRQRFNRLLSAVLDHPELVGIGIDEKTGILVHDGAFEVVGASNVLVVDARHAESVDREPNSPGAARGLGLHVLRAGMRFELAPGRR